ncbi:DUF1694 domain-containing protein [Streptococcus orisratti]|uniref:YueI family protein n=1 Tax=Streptococcus orisratti TaxID=114652 RepID=UPI000366B0EC|nr:YueI family protein [Streptococcus orisratti]
MEELDKKILQATGGECRFNPDEQRKFLGTFAERVVLSVNLADARLDDLRQHFPEIINHLQTQSLPLQLKLSAELPLSIQMAYMKMADTAGLKATVITETKGSSPYGLIIHSDQPVGLNQTDVRQLFPEIFATDQVAEKKSFWSKIFW